MHSFRLSFTTILSLLLTGLGLVLLWQLRGLLVVLMIAVVIAATLSPLIAQGQRWGLPRWLAVLLTYLGLLLVLLGATLLIGPPVIKQIQILVGKLPVYLDAIATLTRNWMIHLGLTQPQVIEQINRLFDLQALTAWGFRSSQELLIRSYGVTRGVIGGIFSVVLALLLSGYMLSGADRLIAGLVSLFPTPWDQRLAAQIPTMGQRMGGYIQGRIAVSAILGVFITIGLLALGLDEIALGLGVIAGVTNLIPFFGPVLGAIPALIVAIAQGDLTFLWVLLLFLIVQNLETYLLDPLLVGSSVKVSPLYQLLGVLGGTQVLGILGALIVPPWVAGLGVLLETLYLEPKRQSPLGIQEGQEQPAIDRP